MLRLYHAHQQKTKQKASVLTNYLKIAFRTIRRHKAYTFINVTGLAIGMACCLLILLLVKDELSYDRFHEKADRIYRVTWDVGDFGKTAAVPASMISRFRADFPEVEAATHLIRRRTTIRHEQEWVDEARFYYADEALFEVFTFPFIKGDPNTALREPNTLVLTASTARRYFGDDDPLGQTLTLHDGTDLRVTGVVEDVPTNAHFTFDAVLSLITLTGAEGLSKHDQALGFQGWQYLLLTQPEAAATVDARLDAITSGDDEAIVAYFGWWLTNGSFDLQPLTEIHLYSNLAGEAEPNSDVVYLYIFSLIALFILLLACINYMNLTTARSVSRGKEVGVRKVIGAQRGQLARQFLSESLILSLGALVLAVVLLEVLLPVFNTLIGKTYTLSYAPETLGLFVVVALLTGLFAGSYPAFYLARLAPIRMLRGGGGRHSSGWLRKSLVTFQFTVSIVLIIATLVMQHQLGYLQNKRLGYDTEQIMQVPLRGSLADQAVAFKTELSRLSGVVNASLASGVPGRGGFRSMYGDEGQHVRLLFADPDYLETMGMTLVDGRNFDPTRIADTTGFLINELGARYFGLTDKIGQPGSDPFWEQAQTPLGIVSDFHTTSLHEPIIPTVIVMDARQYQTVVLRLRAGHVAETLAALEATWQRFVPDEPFRYLFLDALLADQYRAEQRLGSLFIAFSLLAILIACLGLFGLVAFTAEQRTKEIGIRKVFGATVANLVALLSKDFLKLVVLASMIAAPVAYFATDRWLQDFAYRVEISWWIFLMAGLAALGIALLTVAYQSIKAALADPAESLRYE